jgi:phenylacetic acid degradation operon negative regulatory protein
VTQGTQRFVLFLAAQARRFPLRDAVDLGEQLGKSPHSVRACVNRLARSGILVREPSPRKNAWYALSPKGRKMAADVTAKFMRIHDIVEGKHSWDGTWTIVSFAIPESIRSRRDELRSRLRELGFGPLTGGVWIAPGDATETTQELANSLRVGRRVMVSHSRDVRLGGEAVASSVSRIWPLTELNRRYAAMRSRLKQRIKKMRTRIKQGSPPDSREAFLEVFVLFSESAEIVTADPCLPGELLPNNWLGLEVQDLIHEYFHILYGLEQDDRYSSLLELPHGLHIPKPRRTS